MQNQNRPRPHARNPFAYDNPWEMKRPAYLRQKPIRQSRPPQTDLNPAIKGVVDIATISVIAGSTVGILGAFQK